VCWSEALRQKDHDVPAATIHRAIGMTGDLLLDHGISERLAADVQLVVWLDDPDEAGPTQSILTGYRLLK
jgi:hypothetical protein